MVGPDHAYISLKNLFGPTHIRFYTVSSQFYSNGEIAFPAQKARFVEGVRYTGSLRLGRALYSGSHPSMASAHAVTCSCDYYCKSG